MTDVDHIALLRELHAEMSTATVDLHTDVVRLWRALGHAINVLEAQKRRIQALEDMLERGTGR